MEMPCMLTTVQCTKKDGPDTIKYTLLLINEHVEAYDMLRQQRWCKFAASAAWRLHTQWKASSLVHVCTGDNMAGQGSRASCQGHQKRDEACPSQNVDQKPIQAQLT
eukprot:302265-Pelagomonas_calceolata.AAC.8